MIFNDLDTGETGKIFKNHYIAAWVEFMTGDDRDGVIVRYLGRK